MTVSDTLRQVAQTLRTSAQAHPDSHDRAALESAADIVSTHAEQSQQHAANPGFQLAAITRLDDVVRRLDEAANAASDRHDVAAWSRAAQQLRDNYTGGDNYRVTYRDGDYNRYEAVVRALDPVQARTRADARTPVYVTGPPLDPRDDLTVASVALLSVRGPRRAGSV
jgi:hypothetical protein